MPGEPVPDAFDESGLVCYCYGYLGHIWISSTIYTEKAGWHKISVSEAKPGDVVASLYHCGIYIELGLMIHAPQMGDTVKVRAIQADMNHYRLEN